MDWSRTTQTTPSGGPLGTVRGWWSTLREFCTSDQQTQVPQQTGTPPKQTVQAQPAWQQAARHSQQPWVSLQQSLSPERQVMQTPLAVVSQVQLQKQRLHCATQIPFFVQAQLHIPSARLRQRF